MSKYDKLVRYLEASKLSVRRLNFREIEEALGFFLPASARRHSAWWANDLTPSRHSTAWLSAGWQTEQVDIGGEKVTFRRTDAVQSFPLRHRKTLRQSGDNTYVIPHTTEFPVAQDGKVVKLSLEVKWRTLGRICLDARGALLLPAAPKSSGLYQFRLTSKSGVKSYIGETVNLRRRFQHYRNPGPSQATNIRLNSILVEHCSAGDQVHVDIIIGDVVLIIGEAPVKVDFANKGTRRLIENAALVVQDSEDIHSLNR